MENKKERDNRNRDRDVCIGKKKKRCVERREMCIGK